MIIETPSQKLPEAIATLMTTCYSIDRDRAVKRLDNLLGSMIELHLIREYDIRPHGEASETGWEIVVTIVMNWQLSTAKVFMGIKPSEGGYETYMQLEEWNPYRMQP